MKHDQWAIVAVVSGSESGNVLVPDRAGSTNVARPLNDADLIFQ
jgi:hypothetical protein